MDVAVSVCHGNEVTGNEPVVADETGVRTRKNLAELHGLWLHGLTVADTDELLDLALSNEAPEDADEHMPAPIDPSASVSGGDMTAEHPNTSPYSSHAVDHRSLTDLEAPAHKSNQVEVMPWPPLSQHSITNEFKRDLGSDERHQLYTAARNMGSAVVPVCHDP